MPDDGEVIATRVAWLELSDERRQVREGYELLDEKRMLLAGEIMRGLAAYARLAERRARQQAEAQAAMAGALAACGCDGLAVEPPLDLREARLRIDAGWFLGIPVATAMLDGGSAPPHASLVRLPEVRDCAAAWLGLARTAAETAALAGSLRRLAAEYVRTERRARALENVVLPEIDATLQRISEQLDAIDQEEAVRVRNAARPAADRPAAPA